MFPKIGMPQNGWFIMENPIKKDDLRGFSPYFWKHPFGCRPGSHVKSLSPNPVYQINSMGYFSILAISGGGFRS